MSTYAHIGRAEFEAWLADIGFSRGEWAIKQGSGGVYLLFLSPHVAIEINSTTGGRDAVMMSGTASMSLRLVSRHTGRVLNSKAMGQTHFARTTNWRINWRKGVARMSDTYIKSMEFYDTIAQIDDPEKYKRDMLALIEAREDWRTNSFLMALHDRVAAGGVLSSKQRLAIERAPDRVIPQEESPVIPKLRTLWVRAKSRSDQWTMDFAQSLAGLLKQGRTLSPRQLAALEVKLDAYGIE